MLLLISMPFIRTLTPSIQLGTLQAYLRSKGIPVDVNHAYLRCLEFLGPDLYCAFTDEVFYTSFLFPEHFKKYRHKIEKYFKKKINPYTHIKSLSYETVLDRISSFNKELLAADYSKYTLIGFSITFDQLRPSLYIAQEIKRRYPHIPIVFGGAQCFGELGISLIKTFSQIDFVVNGEGEETLTSLFLNLPNKKSDEIKGLVWRDGESIKYNGPPDKLPLESLPIPDYEDYFNKLNECSPEVKNYLKGHLSIPIEGSRGCWWNKCTFCSLNLHYGGYREKSVDQVLHEVKSQVSKYQCHTIRFVDNVQRIKDFDKLMLGLKNLKSDLNIFLELRAGRLKKEDFELMYNAGVKVVQIGIEAIGNRMLEKINKGVTAIENIAALKYCQEFGIIPIYNILINYPNETELDLQETAENVAFMKNFVPPMHINQFQLHYESPVYNNPDSYNIKEIYSHERASWFYPKEILETLTPIAYEYVPKTRLKNKKSAWYKILDPWKGTGEERISAPLLYYQDSTDFLTITDNLSGNFLKYTLTGIERKLYLFCETIQTRSTILEHFPDLSPDHLEEVISKWVANRWVFREEDKLLTLAIRRDSKTSSPLTYFPEVYFGDPRKEMNSWRPAPPKCQVSLKVGSFANINFSITSNKVQPE
jgi:ribosomal peptide maturation radical SAM protein 1